MAHASVAPVGGPLLTRGTRLALFIAAAASVLVSVRLLTGLGPITALNDGFAWGIWKPLNVVTFTGIGAGALGLALVAHVANRGRHHPLVRSAVLTGAITYTLAGISVLVDLGRWWTVWALVVPTRWNVGSVLLEVALCVIAYCAVLWLEVLPALLERWRDAPGARGRLAARVLPRTQEMLPFLLALAIVLPFMHQSSLGALFLFAPTKLHPLWYTGWLPALFLLSCLSMGFGAVIVVDTLTHLAWGRRRDVRLCSSLALVMAGLSLAFVALRVGDLATSGALRNVTGWRGVLFLVELGLFTYPAVRVLRRSYRENAGRLFWAAQLAVAGGALYRFDVYLGAFSPGMGWSYFPSLAEIVFSLGLAAAGVALYVVAVKRLPILSGVAEPTGRRQEAARLRAHA
ncbi:NrfD/PsrC family molybdoenzyme membrane anchor subunit [Anaeromyxobacter sp. Fw109-5]|uniref:NrfD/PsrC family molybdoenzyme membrane anchor subunit n=1 Tax=Anaeromyxobacter sp. (strain Fw109-5) TaxID=404589 RepID=UPI0000ED6FC5|nr:Ni/Fe-hydrogenase cytochrome b subunit [Anaeromyxobacter sp. Fw109-5]ABS27705.1 Polysulphide reductase NrfD [Anaeromyxobacter sp. Fw109-5]